MTDYVANDYAVWCPACEVSARQVYGVDVFPARQDLAELCFWECPICLARVGCHPKTWNPLGTLAGPELRALRGKVHRALDKQWRMADPRNRAKSRRKAYAWLAKELGISEDECHVGLFDRERCKAAFLVLKEKRADGF